MVFPTSELPATALPCANTPQPTSALRPARQEESERFSHLMEGEAEAADPPPHQGSGEQSTSQSGQTFSPTFTASLAASCSGLDTATLVSPRELADEFAALWLARDETSGNTEIRIELSADLLSETHIQFRTDPKTGLSILIQCDDEAARAWLTQHLDDLRRTLAQRLKGPIQITLEETAQMPEGHGHHPKESPWL